MSFWNETVTELVDKHRIDNAFRFRLSWRTKFQSRVQFRDFTSLDSAKDEGRRLRAVTTEDMWKGDALTPTVTIETRTVVEYL